MNKSTLVGMIHLPPLPGSARAKLSIDALIDRATAEAKLLAAAGFDAVMVENFGDTPFAADAVPPETVAAMAILVRAVRETVGRRIQIGVNVLRNDGLAGVAIAATAGADFIRVNVLSGIYATDQGFITGRPREILAARNRLCSGLKIAADVHVNHAAPINQPDIAQAAKETALRAGADRLIVSGAATGAAADLDDVRRVKAAAPRVPLWLGSGVDADNVADYLAVADGVIVGTSLKRGGETTAPLDPRRVQAFLRAARR